MNGPPHRQPAQEQHYQAIEIGGSAEQAEGVAGEDRPDLHPLQPVVVARPGSPPEGPARRRRDRGKSGGAAPWEVPCMGLSMSSTMSQGEPFLAAASALRRRYGEPDDWERGRVKAASRGAVARSARLDAEHSSLPANDGNQPLKKRCPSGAVPRARVIAPRPCIRWGHRSPRP